MVICIRDAFRKYVEGGLNQCIKISGGARSQHAEHAKSRGRGQGHVPQENFKIGAVRVEQLLCDMVDKLFSVKT